MRRGVAVGEYDVRVFLLSLGSEGRSSETVRQVPELVGTEIEEGLRHIDGEVVVEVEDAVGSMQDTGDRILACRRRTVKEDQLHMLSLPHLERFNEDRDALASELPEELEGERPSTQNGVPDWNRDRS